jgi:hypothetical protein
VAQRFYDLGDRLAAQVLAEWDPEDVRTYTRLMERFTRSAVEQAHAVRRHGLDAVPPLPEREEQASPHGPRVEP